MTKTHCSESEDASRTKFSRLARFVAIGILLSGGVTAAAVWASRSNAAREASRMNSTPSAVLSSPLGVQGGSLARPIEGEVITIRPTGFEPREITRPKGLFLLAVENRSGLRTIQLRIDRLAGDRLREMQMPRNKHDWREGFDLPPGKYILSEAFHPEWTCSITIENR